MGHGNVLILYHHISFLHNDSKGVDVHVLQAGGGGAGRLAADTDLDIPLPWLGESTEETVRSKTGFLAIRGFSTWPSGKFSLTESRLYEPGLDLWSLLLKSM